jgi:hypothetical protein
MIRSDGVRDLPLDLIAQISPTNYNEVVFGDTDHDGHNEVIIYIEQNYNFFYRILEEQGDNVYTDEYTGVSLIPYATGDLDGDGKSDLVGQDGYNLYIYESLDEHSYPTRLAWTSPNIMNVEGFTAVGDTDHDGRMELIQSYNPFAGMARLYFFENTGNDAYQQVAVLNVGYNDNTGEKVIADLDGDGRTEIAMAGLLGKVYVFKCTGPNTWTLAWSASTGMSNAYGCEGGIDTNGNGRPELFVTGIGDTSWETHVFEATGVDHYAEVALLSRNDGYLGLGINTLGELDGVPPAEFMMQGNAHFWIFRSPGGGAGWDMIQQIDDPTGNGHVALQTFDVNRNGRAEVLWDADNMIETSDRILVFESPLDPAGLAPALPKPGGSLALFPNPCRSEARFQFAGTGSRSLAVYDGSGRLLRRDALSGRAGVGLWRTGDLPSGAYWLRLEDGAGRALATGRAVVVR